MDVKASLGREIINFMNSTQPQKISFTKHLQYFWLLVFFCLLVPTPATAQTTPTRKLFWHRFADLNTIDINTAQTLDVTNIIGIDEKPEIKILDVKTIGSRENKSFYC